LALFIGGFAHSYMSKKGENAALKEDIAELTRTTKRIEAEISGDLWDRQKRWELKRDTAFETTKGMIKVANALGSLSAVHTIEHNPDDLSWINARTAKMERFLAAMAEYDSAAFMIATICDESTISALDTFRDFSNDLANRITDDKGNVYTDSQKELWNKVRKARRALRTELGIDEKPTPQSTESSAIPTLAKPNPGAK